MSDLPTGWAWADLSQICTSITDGDHQAPPQVSAGIPFLVIGNIRTRRLDFTDCRHVPMEYFESLNPLRRPQKGDVLYSLVGSYGIPVLLKDDTAFCVQRHIGILRSAPEISSAFLALVLSSHTVFDQATQFATGTAQLTVPLSGLRRIRIPLPPRAEQDRIVAAVEEQLSRLDAGVAGLQRVRRNVKLMRAAVLQGAVSGALIGVDPNKWPTRRLSEVAVIASGQTPHGLELANDGAIPFYKVGDMNASEGQFMAHSRGYVDLSAARGFGLHIRPAGTVIFPKRGGAIATNKKRILRRPAAYDLNTMGLMPGADIKSRFLYLWISSIDLNQLADGSNVPQINHGDLKDLELRLPSVDEQDQIVAVTDVALSLIDGLQDEFNRTQKRSDGLRSSIIEAALSGKLAAQDADDEPASALLERISTEHALMNGQKRKRIRKSRSFQEKATA